MSERLLLTRQEAAATLSMSVDSFERFVQPELRLVRRGRLVLIPVAELSKWVERNAARTLA
jgi:excisionase family DNA binding protein